MDQKLWFVAGLALTVLGILLAFVPRLVNTASGTTVAAGTFAAVGIPLAIGGLVLAWSSRRAIDGEPGDSDAAAP